jgi:hypothetical protein
VEITIDRNYDFTPEFNRNKAEAKPVVFHMRRLSTGERDRLIAWDFDEKGGAKLVPNRQGLFLAGVIGIDNLTVNGERVATAKDMLEKPGLDLLFAEAVANIMGANAREDLKN